MAQPPPFWSGKDLKLAFTFYNEKLVVHWMSVEVTQIGEEVQDDVGGEDRSRFDTILDGYGIRVDGKMEEVAQVKRFLEIQASRDAREIPKESAVGFLIYPRNATRAAFQAREVSLGLWSFKVSGRKERNDLSVPLRARYFDPVSV